MIVKLVRYFDYPDLKRQTPKNSMTWGEFTFTEENIEECDYLVILDHPKTDFSIKVPKNNVIHICLEPPNEHSLYRQYGNKNNSLIINQTKTKSNNLLLHGALPWHINKSYDFLKQNSFTDAQKNNTIVWVTSNQNASKGHLQRMNFLNRIKELDFINLYGRGIKEIDDKWDVLHQSKYAIAYENFVNKWYWTEKITDCFLSLTMPIYVGCTKISDFFPKESYIQIDPKDKYIETFFKELVKSNHYKKNFDALITSKELVLEQYQLFPYLENIIKELEQKKEDDFKIEKINLSFKGGNEYFDNYPNYLKVKKQVNKFTAKFKKYL